MKSKLLFYFLLLLSGVAFQSLRAQTEPAIISVMYNGATGVVDLSDDLISYAVRAVWTASTQTSVVTTGTLTQSRTNTDDWTYSPSPNDKLVLVFASGTTMNFVFRTITGYTDGTVDDFLDAHQMDFDAEIPHKLQLSINSRIGYNADIDSTQWIRTITGTTIYEGMNYAIDLTYSGNKHGDIGSSIALYDFYSKITGAFHTENIRYTVRENYRSHSANNSSTGVYAQDRWNLNNNSAQTATHTYQFSDAYCKWLSITVEKDTAYTVVNEPYHWEVNGKLLKDSKDFGKVQFDRTIVEGTWGPHLVVSCTNGKSYLLNRLLNPVVDGIHNNKSPSAGFVLKQNYPNPFVQSTTITYSLSKKAQATLKVFDLSGNAIAILVDKTETAGNHRVKWQAANLPQGFYLYRLTVNGHSFTKRMLLKR